MARMSRTTIMADDALLDQLRAIAKDEGISLGEVIRAGRSSGAHAQTRCTELRRSDRVRRRPDTTLQRATRRSSPSTYVSKHARLLTRASSTPHSTRAIATTRPASSFLSRARCRSSRTCRRRGRAGSLTRADRPTRIDRAAWRASIDGSSLVVDLDGEDYAACGHSVRAYADLALDFVDASVVAIAERLEEDTIATLDRRHFSAVRPLHFEAFTLVP